MKPLAALINTEKAKILHDLFPGEIPGFIEFATGMSEVIQEDEAAQREKWGNHFLSFDLWLTLAGEAAQRIKRYGNKLHNSSALFADQLFDGYLAAFMVHCLTVYTKNRQHPNEKFSIAVDLLFA